MRGNFGLKLQNIPNCLTFTLDFIVMQMNKVNREKGYWTQFNAEVFFGGVDNILLSLFRQVFDLLQAANSERKTSRSIQCVHCHAIENKIKNHASDKVKKL